MPRVTTHDPFEDFLGSESPFSVGFKLVLIFCRCYGSSSYDEVLQFLSICRFDSPRVSIAQQYPNLSFDLVINGTLTTFANLKKLYARRIRLLNDLESPIRGITAVLTPGHTEGHTAYMLRSTGKKLMVVGDTLPTRTTVIQHPEWVIFSDANATTAVRTRFDLMDQLADEKTQILLYHEEFPGLGFIVRHGPSFDFSTVARVA